MAAAPAPARVPTLRPYADFLARRGSGGSFYLPFLVAPGTETHRPICALPLFAPGRVETIADMARPIVDSELHGQMVDVTLAVTLTSPFAKFSYDIRH